MRNVKIIRTIVLLLLLFSSLSISQPKFSVDGGTKFSFGEIYTGATAKKLLTIRNIGTDTLKISNVSAGCGCTGTLMSSDRLAPNDTGTLAITFNSRNISGEVEKSVTLNTNDTTQTLVRILFKANVTQLLKHDPEYLTFRGTVSSLIRQSLMITNTTSEAFQILTAQSNSNIMSVDIRKSKIKPGESGEVECTFFSSEEGTFKGNIEITLDHPKVPILDVRYFALVNRKSAPPALKPN